MFPICNFVFLVWWIRSCSDSSFRRVSNFEEIQRTICRRTFLTIFHCWTIILYPSKFILFTKNTFILRVLKLSYILNKVTLKTVDALYTIFYTCNFATGLISLELVKWTKITVA